MQKTLLPELLSPAGSMESIYAAVNNGCDAIYVGGKQFSARQYANKCGSAICSDRGYQVFTS